VSTDLKHDFRHELFRTRSVSTRKNSKIATRLRKRRVFFFGNFCFAIYGGLVSTEIGSSNFIAVQTEKLLANRSILDYSSSRYDFELPFYISRMHIIANSLIPRIRAIHIIYAPMRASSFL